MSSGLSRRRVAGRGNSSAGSVENSPSERIKKENKINNNNNNVNNLYIKKPPANEQIIGSEDDPDQSHRVAYDPRDLSQGEEKAKQPKLTLMEEVLLVGLKDEQGYLSFWNDNISYTLRGCILIELALRGRISIQKDPARRRVPLSERLVEVINETLTGEVLLDETLKLMKTSELSSVSDWIDLLSGETWNLLKISYQLKQVRERLLKGLVDKGILRTEKKNFLLFDMATHPISDTSVKNDIRNRILSMLSSRTVTLPPTSLLPEGTPFRFLRTVCMVCVCYAANVLENALSSLSHESRDHAFARVDDMLTDFSQWPFQLKHINESDDPAVQDIAVNVGFEVASELEQNRDAELQIEVIAAVLCVFTRLDSII